MTEVMPTATTNLVVELVSTEQDARDVVAVLTDIWSSPGQDRPPLTPELTWALAHSGNYAGVARVDGATVGAAVGFRGNDDDGEHLHSHIAGVLPRFQGSSIGFALKQHQRRWALSNGIERVTWTFDPLVARNAYFNVMKLGARLTRYYVHFYGDLDDGINAGDDTDRCLATWWVASPRAALAAAGEREDCDVEVLGRSGARDVLTAAATGEPVLADSAGATVRLARIPRDIVALRRADPHAAQAWRRALRHVLVAAFADGLEVVGVTRESCYVLTDGG